MRTLDVALKLLQTVAILVAVATFVLNLQNDSEADVVAAWNIMNSATRGASGKADALEYLNKKTKTFFGGNQRVELHGVNLSANERGERTHS